MNRPTFFGHRRRGRAFGLALAGLAAIGQSACSAPAPASTPPAQSGSAEAVDGKFRNPDGSPSTASTWRDEMALWWWFAVGAKKEALSPPVPPGHVLPADQALALLAAHANQDSLTWLGHAAFLIRLHGRTLLVDPFLTDYASPIGGIGPRRYAGPGLAVDRLPPIDALVISHNHYDHLDLRAIRQLPGKNRMKVFVPAGLGALLRENGFSDVTELKWGDSSTLDGLRIISVPAVHFSSRGVFDKNATHWSGYVFESPQKRVYFAGDTAYHDTVFKPLRQTLGPIDVALVPIGAYQPRALMTDVHVDPEEAVQLGRDIGARVLVGMHWGTVVLSTEPPFEAPQRFRAAGRTKGYADPSLWVMSIGETRPLAGAAVTAASTR